ncbi:hypothetical protein JX265_000384 [Neoarthrinium moseri]|uniref:Uncharacterized protein n=1 Tax=Neoarthrinium moseri TaxID=1658444 RepID=A0A9P9WYD8_9PEZI|nr:uncharacterized protein JN550_000634 [Neoarthrinium moseri]KAI1878452.1 hypothetical protein JN550_000634 [Neoarthrinium moseri]KAI1881558.1 hypothetical protein JX265_000384 [Neoarthrinium moseri]
MPPGPPGEPGTLAPPPEGIYRTFEDLLTAVQRVAKDQGYGVVKLRASNYRDGKPTRYDLVCDRGGVKYNSTAKKRNPSTRKVDCPWRAKAVCEVSLQNQWRFAVQDGRHNHEARVPAAPPGQENTPLAQSIRSLTNKLDRIGHDVSQGLARIEQRIDGIEKRLADMEQNRVLNLDSRMSGMDSRGGGMDVPLDNMGGMEPGSMLGEAVIAGERSQPSSYPLPPLSDQQLQLTTFSSSRRELEDGQEELSSTVGHPRAIENG